jgi:ribonuclease E
MPNTPRGGGISRKIPNGSDRKRLKKIMDGLDVPQGMGVIVRTAGAKKTKAEITRDYGYLSRLWDDIRDTTMNSRAPALIHEEGNLVKRSIRDLYNKDIEEVLVQGDDAYKTAKGFIKMLMPSHAKFVKKYEEEIPLFLRFNVEKQIESSLDATVQLKSGGYLVIHPTEALVSVDVNSGRSTKERNVERTALKTNLEAAEELARQMRLRDLAGLIVVDFIDMDENKNNRAVERKMKEVLSRDRARIQTGRISQFGLMEMSRQRRRRSLLEGSTTVCPHCDGVGRKRTIESSALAAVRALEDFAIRGKAKKIRLKCPPDVALYLLNEKRDLLQKVDEDADVFTVVEHDDSLIRPAFTLEVAEKRTDNRKDPLLAIEKELREEQKKAAQAQKEKAKEARKGEADETTDEDVNEASDERDNQDEDAKPRRRRGRRGGRNRRRKSSDDINAETGDDVAEAASLEIEETDEDEKPKRRRRSRSAPKKSENATEKEDSGKDEEASSDDAEEKPSKSRRRSSARRKAPGKTAKSGTSSSDAVEETEEDKPVGTLAAEDAPKSRRRRAAPKRKAATKAKAPAVEDADTDEKPKRKRRAPRKTKTGDNADVTGAEAPNEAEAEAKPKRRRKAPSKTAGEAVAEAPKPKRTRKVASKAKAGEAATEDATAEDASPKPKRTRKAPAKDKAPAKKAAPKKATAKKPASKAKTEKAKTSSDADSADDVPAKPKRTRKAPAKKAIDSEAATSSGKDTDDSSKAEPKRRRKAPVKTAATAEQRSDQKPTASNTTDAAPASTPSGRRRKAPGRKKGGLLDRLMGKGKTDE